MWAGRGVCLSMWGVRGLGSGEALRERAWGRAGERTEEQQQALSRGGGGAWTPEAGAPCRVDGHQDLQQV